MIDPSAPTRPEVVVFDAFGTLFDPRATTAGLEAAFPGRGAAIAARWRDLQLQLTWQRALMGAYRDFEAVTSDALRSALEEAGIAAAYGEVRRLASLYAGLPAYADTLPALHALRALGLRLAIVSNGTPGQLARLATGAGLPEGIVLLSADAARTYKPDPRVYRLVEARTDAPPGRTLFVSSNAWDVAGARHFGFACVWLNRSGVPFLGAGPPPERTVGGLGDLVASLERSLPAGG